MLSRPESGDTLVGSVVAVAEQTTSPWEYLGLRSPGRKLAPVKP